MKAKIFLACLLLWMSLTQVAFGKGLPLQDFWTSQGFCGQAESFRQDYISVQGRSIYGGLWQLKACKQVKPDVFKSALRERGFHLLPGADQVLIAWGSTETGKLYMRYNPSDDFPLSILEQLILNPGQSLKLLAPRDGSKVYFYVRHPDNKYLSMTIDLDIKDAEVDLEAYAEFKDGKLRRKIDYHRKVSGQEGKNFLYALPIAGGLQCWSVQNSYSQKAVRVRIALKEEGRLIPLEAGDKIGGIILKNVPYGRAVVRPEKGLRYSHEALSDEATKGDLTPQGDVIFWLPPGYWQLEVDPFQKEQTETLLTVLKAHLLPVFPGYFTEMDWPASLGQLFRGNEDVRLEIIRAGMEGNRAFVDFSLLNLGGEGLEPTPGELEVTEAGLPGRVLSIERLKTPPEIVILLDSSGSMKGSMKKALAATASFLKGLPADSRITLIDFDTKPRVLTKGKPRKILKSLSKIRANGATALYDAIKSGLGRLEKANRPTLVLFTDGKDANWNDTGPGSKATAEEIFALVKKAQLPIFTIGFGEKPDVITLSRLAALTGGAYYPARDSKALEDVFRRIQNNLGHQWRLYYQRPKVAAVGQRPVLTLLVDNSGSMEGKIEKVREILHDFIAGLPSDFLMQFMTFSDEVMVKQVLSDDKMAIYRGLAEMRPLSGTEILGSLKSAYKVLHAVPSSNRYLVYITDEAMEVDDDERNEFHLILRQLKDDGIKTLFVGMVAKDKARAFKEAARVVAGEYVVSPDPGKMRSALEALLAKIGKAPSSQGEHPLRLVLKHIDRYGRTSLYSAATISRHPLPTSGRKLRDPEVVCWKKGEKIRPYGGELARLVTGDDAIGRQVQVLKRLPLNVSASNQAVKITVNEAIFLSKLRGVKPSRGRLLALTLKLENVLKPQKVLVYPNGSSHPAAWVGGGADKNARIERKIPDYLIPDARLHLFLSWNNNTSFPVSDATCLAETPLILPEQNEIYIRPGHPVVGTLIFVVPEEFMQQMALHLYDTAYGHIDLPISGVLKIKKEQIAELPTKVEGKLSETFRLKVNGYKDEKKLYEVEPESGNVFRVVDITLLSRVQAHLSINPSRRFLLAVDSPKGPFTFNLHPITQRVPMGFYRSRLVTPGAHNRARLVFELPRALASLPCRLVVDIKGGGLDLPVKPGPQADLRESLARGTAKGAAIYVNGVYAADDGRELVADVTLVDQKDQASTAVSDFLVLKATDEARKRFAKLNIELKKGVQKSKGLANFGDNVIKSVDGDVLPVAKDYLLALSGETLVLNSQAKRGLVFFSLPAETKPSDFVLTSGIFNGLSLALPGKPKRFPHADWLTKAREYEKDDEFQSELAKALGRLTQIRKAEGFVKPGSIKVAVTTLDGSGPRGLPVDTPSLLRAGGRTWQEMKSISELRERLKDLKLIPSNCRAWEVAYAPEAVLTQGWLTENELALMAEKILNRGSLQTERMVAALTDKGKQGLAALFGSQKVDIYEVPAIKYEDDQGHKHALVLPFFKDASEIPEYIKSLEEEGGRETTVSLEVELKVRPLASGQRAAGRELSDALAGSEGESLERISLLFKKMKMPLSSLGPWALGFMETVDRQKGRVIRAVLDSPEGRVVGDEVLELSRYEPVELHLRFTSPGGHDCETVRVFEKKEWPTEMFFVIGANVPDLPLNNLKKVDGFWSKAHEQATAPDSLSSLKWLGHGIIARFVGAQTEYERSLARRLGVEVVRIGRPRILVVGFRLNQRKGALETSLDLVQPYPEIRGDEKAQKRFNLLAGFYYSNLEAFAVPKGLNALRLLSLLPKDTKLLPFLPDDLDELAGILKTSGYPRLVWKHLQDCRNFVLFPDKPLVLAGKGMRVAWLEIEPDSNRVWSFLDSGERGVVDTQIGEGLALALDYTMGFWIGVQNSVWATAGFSLVLDDWAQIKTCAHGFARRLGGYLEVATQPVASLKPDKEKLQAGLSGDIPGVAGLSSLDYGCMGAKELQKLVTDHAQSRAWTPDDFKGIFEGSNQMKDLVQKSWGKAKEKYLGFANGYKDGVDWYFR